MNEDFKLYFYGLGAKIMQYVGVLILFGGLVGFAFSNGITSTLIISILILMGGIGLFLFGKAMRFKYKRNSGSIIHRGDW